MHAQVGVSHCTRARLGQGCCPPLPPLSPRAPCTFIILTHISLYRVGNNCQSRKSNHLTSAIFFSLLQPWCPQHWQVNQLQKVINTGRTGHWLNHSKEHCLIGIKGSPARSNRVLDCDVLVAEMRETSQKPGECSPHNCSASLVCSDLTNCKLCTQCVSKSIVLNSCDLAQHRTAMAGIKFWHMFDSFMTMALLE